MYAAGGGGDILKALLAAQFLFFVFSENIMFNEYEQFKFIDGIDFL